MYVDAHCHLDCPSFDEDRDAVLARARAAGVTGLVLAGVQPCEWPRQRALAAAAPGVRWTAGLHPMVAAESDDAAIDEALAALPAAFTGEAPASGIGELGLDTRFARKETLPRQLDCFRRQLAVARALDKPVVLHILGAHGRALEVLRADGLPSAGGMVHAYSGSAELVRDYERLGLHLSIAGTVARPDARKVHLAAAAVSPDRLLIETDAPDLAPPDLGSRRNEPAAVVRVAAAVAAIRGEPVETVLRRAAANAARLFGSFDA